jgi:hypothetical protein
MARKFRAEKIVRVIEERPLRALLAMEMNRRIPEFSMLAAEITHHVAPGRLDFWINRPSVGFVLDFGSASHLRSSSSQTPE